MSRGILTVLMGAPGSGKSTYARRFGFRIVHNDALRSAGDSPHPFLIDKVYETCFHHVVAELRHGRDVVLDTTGESLKVRKRAMNLAHAFGSPAHLVVLRTDLQTCLDRQVGREYPVGEERVRKVWESVREQAEGNGLEAEGWEDVKRI